MGGLPPQTERQVQGNVDESGDVFRSLGVPSHPENRIGYSG
jgi:hypothetical protein